MSRRARIVAALLIAAAGTALCVEAERRYADQASEHTFDLVLVAVQAFAFWAAALMVALGWLRLVPALIACAVIAALVLGSYDAVLDDLRSDHPSSTAVLAFIVPPFLGTFAVAVLVAADRVIATFTFRRTRD